MSQSPAPTTIKFDNGNRAALVRVAADAAAEMALDMLDLANPAAVLFLVGGAGGLTDELAARIAPQFEQGIAPAVSGRALVVDGGTQSGVMAIMGTAAAQQSGDKRLLGIAPIGNVRIPGEDGRKNASDSAALEPNHTHFVLVEASGWGSETEMMSRIIDHLASKAPGVTLLVNGGPIARNELEHSARLGWPIVVLEGSGRLADEVAAAHHHPEAISDPALGRLIDRSTILPYSLDADPEQIRTRLIAIFDAQNRPHA